MDRETVVVSQSVVGFVDYFVYPLFEVLTDLVYPFGDFILDNLSKNKDYWISLNNTDNKQLVKDNEETATQAENKESPKASLIHTVFFFKFYFTDFMILDRIITGITTLYLFQDTTIFAVINYCKVLRDIAFLIYI